MKLQILGKEGKKINEVETKLFVEPIREDLIFKVVEAERIWQPYANKYLAGMDRSISGRLRHKRHSWKSDRGKGLSRIPRKIIWRRGTQFSWEGAIIPSAKGGRRAHPPKVKINDKKINKKELRKALLSALTYCSSIDELKNKYDTLKDKKLEIKLPIVISEEVFKLKTKEIKAALEKILGELYPVAIQKSSKRAGKGKLRGRKNKKNAGAILITGKKEEFSVLGIESVNSDDLIVTDLANNGARVMILTPNSIKDLEGALLK
jgi:large subunit ribosomal protein L4e